MLPRGTHGRRKEIELGVHTIQIFLSSNGYFFNSDYDERKHTRRKKKLNDTIR